MDYMNKGVGEGERQRQRQCACVCVCVSVLYECVGVWCKYVKGSVRSMWDACRVRRVWRTCMHVGIVREPFGVRYA